MTVPNHHAPSNTRPFYANLAVLLGLGLLIHLGFGFLLNLSVDEAHYVLYAAKPDWSYFDHPPMVGWIQWPLVSAGAPDSVIRLIPQLLWLIACLLARSLALRLHDVMQPSSTVSRETVGLWAVALVLLAPVMHVLAVGLLPDTLLMVLVLLIMSVTLTLATAGRDAKQGKQILQWLALGVLLGLAGLSKYTAILPALAVMITLFALRGLRVLTTAGPWLALIVAIILISPVFYWNAQHDWISFIYQLKHGSGGEWKARRLAAFVGIQIVAYGPLLMLGAYLSFRAALRHRHWLSGTLLLFFLIPFLVTGFMSGGGGSLPHWTAPAWLAMTPFAANALAQQWSKGHKALILAFIRAQVVICLLAFAALFFVGIPGLPAEHALNKKNPLADLWGWDQAGAKAHSLAQQQGLKSLTVRNWTLASRLAWYARPLPVHVMDTRFDQFDLWFGEIPPGADSLFVNWSQMKFDLPIKAGEFQACTLIDTLESKRFDRVVSSFEFYLCRHWGATPKNK